MRIAMTLLTVSLAFGSAACKKKDKPVVDNTSMGSGSATATGSADTGSGSANTMAGSGTGSGSADTQMAKKGGNCPSTVAMSTTKSEIKDGKIVLTISSTDKDAVTAIQKRTEELLKAKTDGGAPGTGHDQKGTHGGGMGLCPVHLSEGATAVAKNETDGVVVTITPKDKPDILKGEIDSRITKAADWVKANVKEGDKGTMGGVGGGSANHGMNHSGEGDAKGHERGPGSGSAKGDGKGGGKGTGGGSGAGTGGGDGSGAKK